MPAHSTQTQIEYIHPPAELVELTKAGVEIWRPVVGADGWYDVSNLGRVRSWKIKADRFSRRAPEPSLLTPQKMPKWGYWVVTLRLDGRQVTPLVHCLMAEAFIGPRPGSFRLWQASHADDDPDHNTLDNIRWATAVANSDDHKRNRRKPGNLRPFQERDGVKSYQCRGCQEWKPKDDFAPLGKSHEGMSICGIVAYCRECARVRSREYSRRRRAARKAG